MLGLFAITAGGVGAEEGQGTFGIVGSESNEIVKLPRHEPGNGEMGVVEGIDCVDLLLFCLGFGGSLFGQEFFVGGSGAMGMEDGLGDVTEDAGAALGDGSGGEGQEDFEEDIFDVGGGGEIVGSLGEFGGELVFVRMRGGRVALAIEGMMLGRIAAEFAGSGFVATTR